MAHFAEIDDNNIVIRVIVVEQDVIDSGLFGDPSKWIQTSYNTRGGIHELGGTPLRKNFAAIGYTYDAQRDAFIAPKPANFNSWVFNETTCLWEAPVPMPNNGRYYYWNEETLSWIDMYENEASTPVQEL
jgi:hypothetical protein